MSFLEFASGLALRYLDARQMEALRSRYLSFRKTIAPILKQVYGTFDAEALRVHLEERIGRDFDILMVHSSVNHMQPMFTDTPLQFVRMLMEYCAERTLVMPAFYFGEAALGGAYATFKRAPRFDVRRTPSQMGLATELFRRMPGVVQSRHPIYRVSALGPLADALTAGHEYALTPAGLGTPFEFMANHDTCILGIGKPMQVLTQVHHVEDAMGDAFPVRRVRGEGLDMVIADGSAEIPFRLTPWHVQGRHNMARLRGIMATDCLNEWTFHHVPLFATSARDVTDSLYRAAKRGVTLYEPVDA
jgi:aminoglycoside 3-N-acetyltransferase